MEKYIYFNYRDTLFRIALSRIVYFEADKNYTNLYLSNGQKLVFTFGLGAMRDYLKKTLKEEERHFARIGKSLIINLDYLYGINLLKQQLLLYDDEVEQDLYFIRIKRRLKAFKELYNQDI
jgi:DNA-binding LytR/AlgR family response regulator